MSLKRIIFMTLALNCFEFVNVTDSKQSKNSFSGNVQKPKTLPWKKLIKNSLGDIRSFLKKHVIVAGATLAGIGAVIWGLLFYHKKQTQAPVPQRPRSVNTIPSPFNESENLYPPSFHALSFQLDKTLLEAVKQKSLPGYAFVEACFEGAKVKECPGTNAFQLSPHTTISKKTVEKLRDESFLYYKARISSKPLDKFTDQEVTENLVAVVPAIVLVEPTALDSSNYQWKKGCLDQEPQIKVFGIVALDLGGMVDAKDKRYLEIHKNMLKIHKNMLKNVFSLALDQGLRALTIMPPGCGVFAVPVDTMISAMGEVLETFYDHPNFGKFKLYLNPIKSVEAKSAILDLKSNLKLQDHIVIIDCADITLTADVLACNAKTNGIDGIVVGTVNLLNPEALKGNREWNYTNWTLRHLSAQRTSIVTTAEVASKIRNETMYTTLKPIPELDQK